MNAELAIPGASIPPERYEELQGRLGHLSAAVLGDLHRRFKDMPWDVLTMGDDWLQLVEAGPIGTTIYSWPMYPRYEGETLTEALQMLAEGVATGAVPKRTREKIALFDLTFSVPLYDDANLDVLTPMPWGELFQNPDSGVWIYNIDRRVATASIQSISSAS